MLQISISGPLSELHNVLAFLAREAHEAATDETALPSHVTKPMIAAQPTTGTPPAQHQPATMAGPFGGGTDAQQAQKIDRRRREHKNAAQPQTAPAANGAGPFGAPTAQTQPAPAPQGGPFGAPTPAAQEQPGVPTVIAVQDAISAMVKAGKMDAVPKLLAQFQANFASEIPAEKRADFITAAQTALYA